jgi:hypothetical protein
LETVSTCFIRILLTKDSRNGNLVIKSRRIKPVVAGFGLLSMSRKFLEQVKTGEKKFNPVLSGLYNRNMRKMGIFLSNLVGVDRFSVDLNYFQ